MCVCAQYIYKSELSVYYIYEVPGASFEFSRRDRGILREPQRRVTVCVRDVHRRADPSAQQHSSIASRSQAVCVCVSASER